MELELIAKSFGELSAAELHDIYALRVAVFVVEQRCAYQEVDGADLEALHVWLRAPDGRILAYLRVLPRGVNFPEVSIGRVIAAERRRGLGARILAEGIRLARERFSAEKIIVEAQTYARPFYEKAGFRQTSPEFQEDGIPHIRMELNTPNPHTASNN